MVFPGLKIAIFVDGCFCLARIPFERILEVEAIDSRNSRIDDHTFPAAVILIIPESIVGVELAN